MADEMMLENEQVEEMTPPQSPAETAPPEGGALESEGPAEQADEVTDAPEEEEAPPKNWYVVHTYSGYENKVKDNLEKAVENNGMQNLITEVLVPTEEVVEIRNGKKVTTQHKTFPGYVLVHMIITNESWYVVRNTRGVTGFVGPESKPIPLTAEELDRMLNSASQEVPFRIAVGEEVRILSGPLENFTGVVEEIDAMRQKLRVKVKMFLGREMQIEVDLDQVEKLDK